MSEDKSTEEFWTTCTSRLCEELYERDVPCDNRLCWVAGEMFSESLIEWSPEFEPNSYIPAYREDHLELIIPKTIPIGGVLYDLRIQENHVWHISYVYEGKAYEGYQASSLWKSEALAVMILYLLKNRIINPEDFCN